jgi:ArsR family transcriptional regulator
MAQRKKPQACCPLVRVRPLSSASRDRLTSTLKALSDPTRLEILRTIAAQAGPVCACDIVDRFDLSQPTISHHLKVLRDSGLLIGTREGLWMFYRPDPKGMAALARMPSIIGG